MWVTLDTVKRFLFSPIIIQLLRGAREVSYWLVVREEGLGNYHLNDDQRVDRRIFKDYQDQNVHSRPIQIYKVRPRSSSLDYHSKDNYLESGINGNYLHNNYGKLAHFCHVDFFSSQYIFKNLFEFVVN